MPIGAALKGKLMREMKAKVNSQRTRSASSATPVAARASTSSTPRPTGTRKMFLGKLMEDAQNRVFKKKPEESVGMKKGGAVKPAKKTTAAAPAKKAPAKKATVAPAKKSAKAKAPATRKYNMGGPVTPGSSMAPQPAKASMPARQVGAIGSAPTAQNNAVTNARTPVPPSPANMAGLANAQNNAVTNARTPVPPTLSRTTVPPSGGIQQTPMNQQMLANFNAIAARGANPQISPADQARFAQISRMQQMQRQAQQGQPGQLGGPSTPAPSNAPMSQSDSRARLAAMARLAAARKSR